MTKLEIEQNRVTEQWYEAINSFEPLPDKNYSWLLEYSKFRLDWVFEKTRYVEDKSQSLLKLVLAISAASWAVFSILLKVGQPLTPGSVVFSVAALVCLVISGYYSLQAGSPVNHVYPRGEDKAIEYMKFYESEEAAKGRLALLLGDSSEQERLVQIEKGALVNRGAVFAFSAVISFSVSLLCQLISL
jgi:hypothetical protein